MEVQKIPKKNTDCILRNEAEEKFNVPVEASCPCWKEGWQLEDLVFDCSFQDCHHLEEGETL